MVIELVKQDRSSWFVQAQSMPKRPTCSKLMSLFSTSLLKSFHLEGNPENTVNMSLFLLEIEEFPKQLRGMGYIKFSRCDAFERVSRLGHFDSLMFLRSCDGPCASVIISLTPFRSLPCLNASK
jgi:hypothetical protein